MNNLFKHIAPSFEPEDWDFFEKKDLSFLIEQGFSRLSFSFVASHIEKLEKIIQSSDSSENDKQMASLILKNAQISALEGLPLCQDTGIATIFCFKGQNSPFVSQSVIEESVAKVWKEKYLRNSTNIPSSMFCESDPANNLPTQTNIYCTEDSDRSCFLLTAKGGGSSNKTAFFQKTKADLTEEKLSSFLQDQITKLGAGACPPYSIAVVIGGLSPEENLLALKLATCDAFSDSSSYFRDSLWEQKVLSIASETGIGAQFGGKAMAEQATVIRLPRHGASCPVSIGVSCCAHRNLKAILTPQGVYLQKTVIPKAVDFSFSGTKVDLDKDGLSGLSLLSAGSRVLLSGSIIVARDKAHSHWKENGIPDYAKEHAILYAGPSETPCGKVSGSLGPTTSTRMDSYMEELLSKGASLISIGKGPRSSELQPLFAKYGAFYLAMPSGVAAYMANECILSSEIINYPEDGMEAVRLIKVKDMPAFIIIDNKGRDFYSKSLS